MGSSPMQLICKVGPLAFYWADESFDAPGVYVWWPWWEFTASARTGISVSGRHFRLLPLEKRSPQPREAP